MRRLAPPLLLALPLVLGACSLAGDLTPPPALATAQAQGLGTLPTVTPLAVPDRAPDPQSGALIFADRCAPCHGETGGGDGLQSADLPNPPTPLRQLDVAQRAIPEAWYTVVTQGRFDRFMPGFGSLDDSQRWDVVGYALSLGLSTDVVESGRAVYQAECAGCHGDDGRGDARIADLTTTAFQSDRSWLALYGAITNGVGQAMPAFADALADDERWAAAAYLRSLWLLRPPESPPTPVPTESPETTPAPTSEATAEAEPTATPQAILGAVAGRVDNGTAGAGVPAGLEVVLHALDGGAEVLTETARAGDDGTFVFEGLELVPGRLFAVTAEHQDVLYASDIGSFDQSGRIELPLTVFETTASTESVRVGRLHLLFEFPGEGALQVVELWLLSNLSDRTVMDPEQGAIEVELPPDAFGLSFDGGLAGERFLVTDTGFRDRRELVPGENTGELIFSYNLPYQRRLEFHRPVAYPVTAVVVLVSQGGPAFSGEGLIDGGVRDVGGTELHSYSLGSVEAGGGVALTISGRVAAGPQTPSNPTAIAFGAAALVAALLGAAWIWYRPRRRPKPAPVPGADDEAVLWAIASLDNEFDAGRVEAEDYRTRRRDLVARLRDSGGD